VSVERVLDRDVGLAIERWSDPMPEEGDGTLAALSEPAERGGQTAMRSTGPRFGHFVMGGGTPAALAAYWLTWHMTRSRTDGYPRRRSPA
jgi:hypothetical protein